MSAHADLAPSAMNRIINCPASVRACLEVEARDDDEWNIEGTEAHKHLELWLELGVPPTDGILYEQLEYAYDYAVDLERRGYKVYFEKVVRYSERVWGTADILGVKARKLDIADYKHGYRPVEIKGNAQVPTYGIAARREFGIDFTQAKLTIIQPRIPHIDGVVRSEIVDDAFLDWHQNEVEEAIRRVDSDNPVFMAGRHCKFCPLEGNCKTYTNWVAKLATGEELFV
jgi:hypothetical protein